MVILMPKGTDIILAIQWTRGDLEGMATETQSRLPLGQSPEGVSWDSR